MSMEVVFPFLKEDRERNEKRRLDFLKGLLEIMDREEGRLASPPPPSQT